MAAKFTEIPYDDIEFLELVGGGRFGSVYKTKWHDKIVAVKKTLCFNQEATLLASIRHRNIITFYGACTAAPNSFLVTEYAEHGSLYNFLENVEALEVKLIRSWLCDLARGLRYLHHEAPKRIIHRDLKSLNVLVCDEDDDLLVLKLCDFGSSRQISRDTKSVTSAGTVSWMAPEVIRNEHVSEKCDVWSFGVIAWELVTLEVPYAGMEPYSVLWLVAKHGMRLHIPHTCPSRLADMMKVCMAQNPADRPSFDMLVRLLEDLSEDGKTFSQLEQFVYSKGEWLDELEKITEGYASLEANSALIAAQRAEIERREAALRLREEALRLQLNSDSFLGNHSATPNTPHHDAVQSKFSSDVPARHWSVQQVVAWVSVLPTELRQYAPRFEEHDITGDVLIKLTEDSLLNAIGMKPYGHRFRFLEHVKNIQKSSEFPPLSSVSGDESIVVNDEVIIDFVLAYKPHDPMDTFSFLVRPEQEMYLPYIQQVEFVLTCPTRTENDVQVCHRPPFEYTGTSPRAREKATLMLRISYKTHLFRRKTTKRNFCIDGNMRMEALREKLVPKHSHLRVQPATAPRTPSVVLSTASSSTDTGGLSRATSSTAPKVPPSPSARPTPPMVLRNDNPWFSDKARRAASAVVAPSSSTTVAGRSTIYVGSQWPVMPGPGVNPMYQPPAPRHRSDSVTSTASMRLQREPPAPTGSGSGWQRPRQSFSGTPPQGSRTPSTNHKAASHGRGKGNGSAKQRNGRGRGGGGGWHKEQGQGPAGAQKKAGRNVSVSSGGGEGDGWQVVVRKPRRGTKEGPSPQHRGRSASSSSGGSTRSQGGQRRPGRRKK